MAKDIINVSLKKINIYINIYGLLHDAYKIGELLWDNDIFLQPPLKYDVTCKYQNPQCYNIFDGEHTEVNRSYTALTAQGKRVVPVIKNFAI